MKSITEIVLLVILFSGVFSNSPQSSWALNQGGESRVLEARLEKKLEEALVEWIRYLYPSRVKRYLTIGTEVTLVPGKFEYNLRPKKYDIKIWTGYRALYGSSKTMVVGSTMTYQLNVSADFVTLFETEDALFAYTGILAQGKKIFEGDLEDLLKESQVRMMAEFMMSSGKNPYGYLRFIEHLYSFLNSGEEINPKVLARTRELLDRLTGANDDEKYSFKPLPAKLLVKSYLEKTMQVLAEKLGVSNQFESFKVDLSENDTLELFINGNSNQRSLLLRLPKKWSETFSSEDQFVALIVYALLWDQEASKKNGSWGPDSVDKLDRIVVDTLLTLDVKRPPGYNPKEYYNLLFRIDQNPRKFAGLFQKIQQVLLANQINPNTRITVVQSYLSKLEIKHADIFAKTYPFEVFAKKIDAKKSFKSKRLLNSTSSRPTVEHVEIIEISEIAVNKEEIQSLPTAITYEALTSYITNNQGDPKLDFLASQKIKLLPADELTFPVLARFFDEEKRKERENNNNINETLLPISVLTVLNTFLSRLEVNNLSHWVYWNSVYELVQDGIVGIDKYGIPARVCEDWEANFLKLLAIQIEGTNFLVNDERTKLVKNLQNFARSLGPCANSFSKDKIFKLLMSCEKVDLALMIEWDNDNSYQKKNNSILKIKGVDDLNFLESTIFLKKEGAASVLAQQAIEKLSVPVLRIDALDKLSLQTTHESYLKALVRRAGKIHYDTRNLLKLHSFLSRNQTLAQSMRDQDHMRMTLAAIRHKEVPPSQILLPSNQNRLDMEKVVETLCEGQFSCIEILSSVVKMENSHDLIKRYLDHMTITYEELTSYINNNQEDAKLDLLTSPLVKLLPATELTFPVLARFFDEEKRKERQNNKNETRLPISVLTALNTFLSRLEVNNLSHWAYWNAVYHLVQDGIIGIDKYYIPARICEDWEANFLKLLAIQIERTNFLVNEERTKLVKNLHNFEKLLGPCTNSLSKEKIFKLLMSCEKVDLALMIEWDNDNSSYQKRNNSILKIKGLDDLNFLESTIFHRLEGAASVLAQQAIEKLSVQVLRIDALDKLSPQTTHESYLKALVRRAGKIYYDTQNLIKLHNFVGKNITLAHSMRDQDLIRMTLAAIREGEVAPHQIVLPLNQNRLDMENIVDTLCEGQFSYVDIMSLIVKMENSSDLIKRYIDRKPLRSFDELIKFLEQVCEATSNKLFANAEIQYIFFKRISEQFPDQEYSVANFVNLQQVVLKTQAKLKFPGLHPLFFRALKVLQDPNELAQIHRIWLETMVDTGNNADWVIKNGSQKDYLKAVLAALEAEDENLILEHPEFSSTAQARDNVFDILMKSDLSNEFIQKWIESVFAGKTTKSEQRKKEKFLSQLREQRPARSLEDVAIFLNQTDYRIVNLKMSLQCWQDCKHLFRTVPSAEFTPQKVKQFISSIKNHPISTLAVSGWYLKHTRKENTEQLVQIFELIRDAQSTYAHVNQTFYNQLASHFDKMIRAVASHDPSLLLNSFTPASFSKIKGGAFQSKVNWVQELYRIAKEARLDSKTILSLLVPRNQARLIIDFFNEFYSDFDQDYEGNSSQLVALNNVLSYIDNSYLKNKISSPLILNIPKKDATWESIFSFASSFKDGSYAPVYAMLRLLELSEDPFSLASIHSFLAKYTADNKVEIISRQACSILLSNFDKMIKGSFTYQSASSELRAFTPVQMGCHSDLDGNQQKAIILKYQFRVLMRAAQLGAIDSEGILIELQDPEISKSQQKVVRAIEQIKRMRTIGSFEDLESLLKSTENKKKGFTLKNSIFQLLINHFPDSQFERDKVQPVLKYLNAYDQRQIILRLARVSHADDDMDFVVREVGGSVLTGEKRFEKTMLGSIRKDPENLFRFPILTVAHMEYYGLVLRQDWYDDSFIQTQLIEQWMSSGAPKEYLLAWLRFLPVEFGKRDRALKYFIQRAGIRSLAEWSELVDSADKVIESKKAQEKWLTDKESVKENILWNDLALSYLFDSLSSSELSSHQIVEFVKSQSEPRLDINQTYALNWALLRASSTKDYLELHSELLLVRENAPPAFCKSLEYMTNYMSMIQAVMNHNPEEALRFYDIPIQENNLNKYFSEEQAKRKHWRALDALADNLMVNYKHWPAGMAWLWITKYIPTVAKSNNQGLASLFQAPLRPRTEPTEAMIEIATRRGILSFKDITTEIESAKAIDSKFALEPQTQKAILERLPQESFTFDNLKSYADIDAVWTRQTLGESILATAQRGDQLNTKDKKTIFELELEQRKDRPDLLETYLKTKKIIAENPILTYDLENSEKMQKVFIDKMREAGAWPEGNLKQQHEILFSLAKRGPSELTDELLYNLYMSPSFECSSCIEETIQSHAFWDLHRRKEIYEKYLQLTNKIFDEQIFTTPENMCDYATEIVATVNLFFPIPSMERSEILERLANDLKASEKLTQMIEDEKGRGVDEEAALGLGLYLMNKVLNIYPADEERMALVKFFVKNDELPEPIAHRFRQQVGVNRLRRQFLELPAYGKALAINALIVNLLPKSTYRRDLEYLIWDNVQEENRDMAKLFYRSFVKALQETAPFQESIFVAFLLGQLANVQGSNPGEKLKYILESLGGTGISIGQKIYQRRMIPDEYLEHLKNMTDQSPLPSRKAIYDRLRVLLKVEKVSDVLSVQEILGGASTALVVRVIFKDGKEAALKMTFEDLPKRTQVEFRKMQAALNYLVEDGGSMYNRLGPVIQEVHDGLKGQEDLTQERDKTAIMKYLYERENNNNNKIDFKVIQTLTLTKATVGDYEFDKSSPEHVFMELAQGKTLTRLSDSQKKEIFPEIFKKEMTILLAEPNKDGMIYFEKDRHMGNFIVDFSTNPLRISVYDYPLLSSISAKERVSLFKLIGWLEARRMYGTNLITQRVIDSKIADLLASEIAQAQLSANKIAKFLSAALAGKSETSEKLFAIFAIVDEVGTRDKITVRSSLISYTVALGHAERYAQFVESPDQQGAFRQILRPHILKSDEQFKKMDPTQSESVYLEETQETLESSMQYK